MSKKCELYDRICSNCGECLVCDLDSNKQCDNCGKCLDEVDEFRSVNIMEFMEEQKDKKKFPAKTEKKRKN